MAHLVINLPQINMSHVNTRHKIIVVLNLFCEIALVLDLENAKQEKNWVELTTSLFFWVWHCRILCFGCWINRCLQHNNLFRLFLNSLDWNVSVILSVTYIPSILLLMYSKIAPEIMWILVNNMHAIISVTLLFFIFVTIHVLCLQ